MSHVIHKRLRVLGKIVDDSSVMSMLPKDTCYPNKACGDTYSHISSLSLSLLSLSLTHTHTSLSLTHTHTIGRSAWKTRQRASSSSRTGLSHTSAAPWPLTKLAATSRLVACASKYIQIHDLGNLPTNKVGPSQSWPLTKLAFDKVAAAQSLARGMCVQMFFCV